MCVFCMSLQFGIHDHEEKDKMCQHYSHFKVKVVKLTAAMVGFQAYTVSSVLAVS